MAQFCQKSVNFIRNHPKFDKFITILEGAVRSSKTWTMIPKVRFALNNYHPMGDKIIFGVSKDTIYNNVLNELFNFIGTRNYTYNRQNGDLWLYDTKWSVVGAKDEGSEKYIRGRTVGIAYGDELVLIPKSFMSMMTSRMSDEGARLYGTTNPDSPYHYIYKEYLAPDCAMQKQGLVRSIKFTIDDNLSLSDKVRDRYRNMYKGVFHKRMIQGLWVIAEGAVYKDCLDDDLLYDDTTRPLGLLNQGGYVEMFIPIDYGTGNPTVFLHIVDDGDVFWVDDEYYWDSRSEDTNQTQKTDDQYVDDLEEFIKAHASRGAECIVDPSAASLKAEMEQRGIWHCNAVNDVEIGIKTVASLLGKKKIRIHKRCVKLWAELGTYAWNPKKQDVGEDVVIKKHDHGPDALRYFAQTKVQAWRVSA